MSGETDWMQMLSYWIWGVAKWPKLQVNFFNFFSRVSERSEALLEAHCDTLCWFFLYIVSSEIAYIVVATPRNVIE